MRRALLGLTFLLACGDAGSIGDAGPIRDAGRTDGDTGRALDGGRPDAADGGSCAACMGERVDAMRVCIARRTECVGLANSGAETRACFDQLGTCSLAAYELEARCLDGCGEARAAEQQRCEGACIDASARCFGATSANVFDCYPVFCIDNMQCDETCRDRNEALEETICDGEDSACFSACEA